MHKFSDVELILLLQKYYNETGKVPTQRNLKEANFYLPSYSTYINRFGSFQNALIKANLRHLRKDNHSFDRKEYSQEELLSKLNDFLIELGHLPSNDEIENNKNMPSCGTYLRYFGSFENAFKILNIDLDGIKNEKKNKMEQDMISKIKELAIILGRTPHSRDIHFYKSKGFGYGIQTYLEHFGNMYNVYKLAELNAPVPGKHKTKEELINDLQHLAMELGRTPLKLELKEYNHMASISMYEDIFGSWNNALIESDLELNTYKIRKTKNGTKCYSYYEYKLACLLEKLKIPFEKEIYYKDIINSYNGNKRFDFVLNINNANYYIEIFGITGNTFYDECRLEKLKLCSENNIILVELYPDDFWGKNNKYLIDKLFSYMNRQDKAEMREKMDKFKL